METNFTTFIRAMPKVELHCHLEGSIQTNTLRELASIRRSLKKNLIYNLLSLRKNYTYGSCWNFFTTFGLVSLMLETPADYALVAQRLLESLASQNVRYVEIIVSAGVILLKRQPLDAVFEALIEVAATAETKLGIRTSWIFDAVRELGVNHAFRVLKWATHYKDQGVIAFGIGGNEIFGPAKSFIKVYQKARDEGLHLTIHAGENRGPDNIRESIELLGVERITHAISADNNTISLLKERNIPLEICLSSNLGTGVIKKVQEHPLPDFFNKNLLVTLNTDNPGLFGTSLENEFLLAQTTFGFQASQLTTIIENSIKASFIDEIDKYQLLQELKLANENYLFSQIR